MYGPGSASLLVSVPALLVPPVVLYVAALSAAGGICPYEEISDVPCGASGIFHTRQLERIHHVSRWQWHNVLLAY